MENRMKMREWDGRERRINWNKREDRMEGKGEYNGRKEKRTQDRLEWKKMQSRIKSKEKKIKDRMEGNRR